MASDGNPLFQFRLCQERQDALREVAMLSGYEYVGDLVREILQAVVDRNVGRVHAIMRRIDRKVGVQLDLALMAKQGGPVLPAKRLRRASKALVSRKGAGPP
jgi:hypothetical protein